jgi:pimeloyl-ACP methyl ester carboxylesterase
MPKKIFRFALIALPMVLIVMIASTLVKIRPRSFFWVERKDARMPVWVRGKVSSGIFIVFCHGGPGSCGTAEPLFEVNPADGHFDHVSPLKALETDSAMVYWDQRHSGMSGGRADPDDSRIEDFGQDLALVIQEINKHYRPKRLFLIGQSWGHAVALSYLTLIDDWQAHQASVDGYIIYKGNHEQDAPYQAARPRLMQFARQEIAAGRDVGYWQTVLRFYEQKSVLSDPADFRLLDEYIDRTMHVSYPLPRRIWAFFRASIFSPFNGWPVYFNNKRTMQAARFLKRVITEHALRQTLPRLAVPTLLIYGAQDLKAPWEIGQGIFKTISTPESRKTLLVLPHSQHGAEGPDILIMQKAIRDFIQAGRNGWTTPVPRRDER